MMVSVFNTFVYVLSCAVFEGGPLQSADTSLLEVKLTREREREDKFLLSSFKLTHFFLKTFGVAERKSSSFKSNF